jgi:hypothetical protein
LILNIRVVSAMPSITEGINFQSGIKIDQCSSLAKVLSPASSRAQAAAVAMLTVEREYRTAAPIIAGVYPSHPLQ